MRNRRRQLVLALLLLFALVAASCGDDGDGGQDAAPGGEEPAGGEELSSEVDRSGRFSSLDSFCEPGEDEGDAEPTDVGPGITAEVVKLTHVRVQLEDLVDIGFAVDVGDQTEQFQTFVDIVNERCGGIHGRVLEMETLETPGLPPSDVDAHERENCIKIAEDQDAVFAFSVSGYGSTRVAQCLAVEHDVTLLSTSAPTSQDFEAGDGRVLSVQMEPSNSHRQIVHHAHDQGLLEGKRIAVVHSDAPGDGQNAEAGLLNTLDELGYDVVRRDVIGCEGGSICRVGVAQAVQGIVADDIDVVFPTLNVISFPTLLAEFVTQGVQKGDIQFFNSNYNNQAGDLVSGKIVEFGGEDAGRLYDETILTDSAATGNFRLPGFEVPAFDAMCNREYAENNPSGTSYERNDTQESLFGSVTTACSVMRIIARALDAAGPNPTRDDITEAIRSLGGVDLQGMVPASLGPDKYAAPDAVYPLVYRFPCQYETVNPSGSCITPTSDEPIPLKD